MKWKEELDVKKCIMVMIVLAVMLCGSVMSFATADSAVTIISPTDTAYGDNLLVSIKVSAPRTIKVSVFEEKQKSGDTLLSINPLNTDLSKITSGDIVSVAVTSAAIYKASGTLQFYNKEIAVSPGLYRVKADTLNSSGDVVASTNTRVVVTAQSSNVASGNAIFQTQQPGALQWMQNFLKNLFGN
jgi:lipoprotein-anchoring transpeptidase ErfK/SrfK